MFARRATPLAATPHGPAQSARPPNPARMLDWDMLLSTALLNDSERVGECHTPASAFASQLQGRCEAEHGHAGRPRGWRLWECLCTAVPGDRLPAIQVRRALTRPARGLVIVAPSWPTRPRYQRAFWVRASMQCACHVCAMITSTRFRCSARCSARCSTRRSRLTATINFRKVSSMRYRVDTQEQPHAYRPHYPPTSEPL
jgi:hypothetical protein